MQQSAVVEQQTEQHRKPRGRPWQPGQSGNPSGGRISVRANSLFAEMAADWGGANSLSAIDRALLMQACRLMARAARAKDADAVVRLTSEARRILVTLRKRAAPPSPPGPTLSEYLASVSATAPQEAPDDEPNDKAPGEEARQPGEPPNGGDEAIA
jgi:hypothetical protein